MLLKSIELSGFKSFAKRSELVFSSPISAIVGPNGSGKSNIAEAFRFVLGEQSIKSLRGKKGEDLIFNGTGDVARANRASVKVTFDNSRRFLPVDYETVTIERLVHRDSVNEYLINGSQVRLKDVIELLAAAHIGSSGHHIISQGEADRILNASLRERKSMIEDALGLKAYQYKKQESEKKLAKTRENIAQVESLRREIMPHIRFLKKQVEKVQRAMELKEELRQRALEYANREHEYVRRTTERLAAERVPLDERKAALDRELSEARAILDSAQHHDTVSGELSALERQLSSVRDEKDAVLSELGRIDGEISSLLRMIKKQEEVSASSAHKTVTLVSVEELYAAIKAKFEAARNAVDSSAMTEVFEAVDRMLRDFIESNKENVDLSLLIDARNDIERLKGLKTDVETRIADTKSRERELAAAYDQLKIKIETEKDQNRDAEKAVFRIMAEMEEVRSRMHTLAAEEENLRLVREDWKRELTELGMMLGRDLLQFEQLSFDYSEPRSVQEERRRTIEKIKIRLEDAGGAGGSEVMKEYTDATERDAFLARELSDLERSAESLGALITDLDERLSTEFKTGVEKINHQFKEYFGLMFGGGEARLSVIAAPKRKKKDTDDLLTEETELADAPEETEDGIDIDVSLPKKKVKGLMMLSGGERALTSIALLFAVSQVNPPPFIILDETDAALDEANSRKYADMIENLSRYSQLIVITHNRETMSRAGILYGVTMGLGGGSKLLSVAFDEAVAVAK